MNKAFCDSGRLLFYAMTELVDSLYSGSKGNTRIVARFHLASDNQQQSATRL